MDAGADAIRAVDIACRRSNGAGQGIDWIESREGVFVKKTIFFDHYYKKTMDEDTVKINSIPSVPLSKDLRC